MTVPILKVAPSAAPDAVQVHMAVDVAGFGVAGHVLMTEGGAGLATPVGASNALPVTDAAAEASLAAITTATGALGDPAYTTGPGSIVALLKGLYVRLTGTLAVAVSNFPLDAAG